MAQGMPDNVWICQTEDEVMGIVKDNRLAVVKLGARWCGPCKTSHPAYYKLAAGYAGFKNIAFLSVDIDDNPMYNEKISAVPAFIFYLDGNQRDDVMQLGADMTAVEAVVTELVAHINSVSSSERQAPPQTAVPPHAAVPGRTLLEEARPGYATSGSGGYGHTAGGYATHTDEFEQSAQQVPRMGSYTRH